MGSEPEPIHYPDRRSQHITAIELFDGELNSLLYPVNRESLKEAAKRLLIRTLGYGSLEATTRIEIFDKQREIPQNYEIENDQPSLRELLKSGLFDGVCEEFIILYGKEEFDHWIGSYIRSTLSGHLDDSSSYEHEAECPEMRFCPALVMMRATKGRLYEEMTIADNNCETNARYVVYGEEIIHMNVKIVNELVGLGVFNDGDARRLLVDYRHHLRNFDEFEIPYDESFFECLNTK